MNDLKSVCGELTKDGSYRVGPGLSIVGTKGGEPIVLILGKVTKLADVPSDIEAEIHKAGKKESVADIDKYLDPARNPFIKTD